MDFAPLALASTDVDRAALVLARAFQEDPGFIDAAPDPALRARTLLCLSAGVIRYALRHGGWVDGTPEPLRAVAVWMLARACFRFTLAGEVRSGFARLPLLAGTWVTWRLQEQAWRNEVLHHRHVGEPHLYLVQLGVAPEHQGRGLGAALLRPSLQAADAQGLPCYLETYREANLKFYQRLGFRVMECDAHTPAIWAMRREPGAHAAL